MKLYYSDHIELQAAKGSRFPVQKYRLLREHLQNLSSCQFEFTAAQEVSLETLSLAHEKAYIDSIVSGGLSADEARRIGFPWSEALVARSRCSVGATIAACKAALIEQAAANLAGGTHHAFANFGAGYCVFNDVAVASRLLNQRNPGLRILIVDADVHQGDGTAAILGAEKDIYTFSIHCMDNFPARKQVSHLDVPLMTGTGDDEYLRQFNDGFKRAMLASRANFLIYLAGADPFKGDRLGRLEVSMEALVERDQIVFSACRLQSIPVAVVMGGGYANDVKDIVEIHANTILGAAGLSVSSSGPIK
ncbi:MAG: histone deacetylase family protein [Gammaproteobacteria bacterium]